MVSERIRVGDEYYLLASALAPRRPRNVLNQGDTFGIFDAAGDIPLAGVDAYGLFFRGTRFLDRLELRVNRAFPLLLSSGPSDDGNELITYLSNADEVQGGEVVLRRDTIAVERSQTLLDGRLYQKVSLNNYGTEPLQCDVGFLFANDFADLFELRGVKRPKRGHTSSPSCGRDEVRLLYRGLDEIERETRLTFSPAPTTCTPNSAHFILDLQPKSEMTIEIRIECHVEDAPNRSASHPTAFSDAISHLRTVRRDWKESFCIPSTGSEAFNELVQHSAADLSVLCTDTAYGPYAYAGLPWFGTIFGRDGLITALEVLPYYPRLAVGTLRTLAALQGTRHDDAREEEPGKILHEMRFGEMASMGEVPFGRYYGSVDATPLFVILLAEYADRTADLELVAELWPAALAAMRWIDDCGDMIADGYTRYQRRSPRGLANQGWKDSGDAVMHADGKMAPPPIALAEVQAYVYAARIGLAQLARRLGRFSQADEWQAKALHLREQFNDQFWMPDKQSFALALDGNGQPCRVVASNAGHCLFGGIAEPKNAAQLMGRLLRDDLFCGWGLRTLSAEERSYNPISYHNGSVWPHDNAIIAVGCARYGETVHAARILTALFDASAVGDKHLPELFCGFDRHSQQKPVPYPVACKPQAWAAGSLFLTLQATLGLSINAWERRIILHRPELPHWIGHVHFPHLQVREQTVSFTVARSGPGGEVVIRDQHGPIDVEICAAP